MKKKILLFLLFILFLPNLVLAQTSNSTIDTLKKQDLFPAKVVNITDKFTSVVDKDNNRFIVDQSPEALERYKLHKGDKVLVSKIIMEDGEATYLIVDMMRRGPIYLLIFLFIFFVLLLMRRTGFRALISLFVSLLLIIFILVPLILKGWNSLILTIVIASIIFVFSTYFIYGINKKSHAAVIGTGASIIFGGLLAYFFVSWTSLSGFVSDEATFIISLGYTHIDMRGLLLSGIIIGTLGIIGDLTVSQASLVKELYETNSNLSKIELYKKSMRVGTDHMGSMINTLIFAYIGSSFSLFLMFVIKQPPFDTLSGVINNEVVATEIVRTLVGSIALLLSVPITTLVAVKFFKK